MQASRFKTLLYRKFVCQTASIYGGTKGLFDLLPCGDAVMDNLINAWRKFFIINEEMLSVKCSMLTPEEVLIASGHVGKFNDYMVKDTETGEFFRADHLVEKHLETLLASGDKSVNHDEVDKIIKQIDNFGLDELSDLVKRFNMKSPEKNNALSELTPFNLMFQTNIGPGSSTKAYLRPETAQGIFINFNKLLDENNGDLPFAAAQIGTSFRNEISPRSGLLRVREFQMAEIEHFLDPTNKDHEKFHEVAHLDINMFPSNVQMAGGNVARINIGDAVARGLVANQTLGYFIGRIYMFLIKIGIKDEKLRFRQHMPNEMAHYACDCWDAEILTSYGWVECVGCADRSAYDLDKHTKCSGTKLVASRILPEPKNVKCTVCKPIMSVMGKTFKKNAKLIGDRISELSADECSKMISDLQKAGSSAIEIDGTQYEISNIMVDIVEKDEMIHTEEFTPNVIEPSFGLGRILYCLLEHNFDIRDGDDKRSYFTLPAWLAPYKFAILPLSKKKVLVDVAKSIMRKLKEQDIFCKMDSSAASIGKRYARADEIGTAFGLTVDFDTVNIEPASVTVRERDSMKQIRVPVSELPLLANDLSTGRVSWTEAMTRYPEFEGQASQ